jgi:hypothetical protein
MTTQSPRPRAGVLGGGPQDMFCSAAQDAFPLNGMVWMYMLMSAFHSGPWLKLISSRRAAPAAPDPAFAKVELKSTG